MSFKNNHTYYMTTNIADFIYNMWIPIPMAMTQRYIFLFVSLKPIIETIECPVTWDVLNVTVITNSA